jgi:hypothetical protein
VSCPVAAASGVIDADGVAGEPPEPPEAPEVAGAVVAAADGVGTAAADELLPDDEDEHPATARSTPATAVIAAAKRRSPRGTKADTEPPTPDLEPDS